MKTQRHRYLILIAILSIVGSVYAQGTLSTYYASARGKKGQELKSALAAIIHPHTALTYEEAWEAYKTTDVTAEGKIWDMYSDVSCFVPGGISQGQTQAGTEGTTYNREHSFPKSWWGTLNDKAPQYTDLYHLIPADGRTNTMRGNICYGEVGMVTYASHGDFSKIGSPTDALVQSGCQSAKVFEPNDVYKGDIARQYFYMATCYEDSLPVWYTRMQSGATDGSTYPGLSQWTAQMMLRWAKSDVVGPKEQGRVEAINAIQHNRNPFIDFPGLEQYIWGTHRNVAFDPDNYQIPSGCEPASTESSLPYISIYTQQTAPQTRTFQRMTSNAELKDDGKYILVNPTRAAAVGIRNKNSLSSVDITFSDGNATSDYINQLGYPYVITLKKDATTGLFHMMMEDTLYVGNNYSAASPHYLSFATTPTDAYLWQINTTENGVSIHSTSPHSGYLTFYNGGKTYFFDADNNTAGIYLYRLTDEGTPSGGGENKLYEYYFYHRSWQANDKDGLPANWTSIQDAYNIIANQGVGTTVKCSGASAVSPIEYQNVDSVVVTYCTNKAAGAGTVYISVGDKALTTEGAITSEGGSTLRTLTYVPDVPTNGSVKLTVECTTNSIYIHHISIYTHTGNIGGGDTPDTPGTDPDTPGTDPDTPGTAPDTPGDTPDTPGTDPDTPGDTPDTPSDQPEYEFNDGHAYHFVRTDSIISGRHYLVGASVGEKVYVLSPYVGTKTSGYLPVTEMTLTDNYLATDNLTDACTITGTSTGGYTIMDSSSRYITKSTNTTNYELVTAPSATGITTDNLKWTVTTGEDGKCTICNKAIARNLTYLPQYTTFRAYAPTTLGSTTLPSLYMLVEEHTTVGRVTQVIEDINTHQLYETDIIDGMVRDVLK